MPTAIVSDSGTAAGNPTAERRWPALRDRRLTASVVYTLLVVLCLLAAYYAMFSQFAPYDDEGFFDYSLKLFVGGHTLYNSVFSEYGPFYYELFGGLFALIGHGVNTDAGRLIQLVVWVAASLGLGLAAHRLTGRLAIGVAALATSFTLMNSLTNEPMHPEALVCALLTAIAMVTAFGLRGRPRSSLFVLGALLIYEVVLWAIDGWTGHPLASATRWLHTLVGAALWPVIVGLMGRFHAPQ